MAQIIKKHHNSVLKTSTQKMKKYRDKMRASGLRPVQIWIPDTRSARFAKEAKKQSLSVSAATYSENEALNFIEGIADW